MEKCEGIFLFVCVCVCVHACVHACVCVHAWTWTCVMQLSSLCKQRPVVLVPSHRSYLDFILVSYILLKYNLPLPCIAAGLGKWEWLGGAIVWNGWFCSVIFFSVRS